MRTILTIVAVVAVGGCAGTPVAQRKVADRPERETPVVTDQPSLSEKRKLRREMEDRQAYRHMTRVEGNLTR